MDAVLAAPIEDVFDGLRIARAADPSWPDRVRRLAHAYRGAVRAHPNPVRHQVANAPLATAAALAARGEL